MGGGATGVSRHLAGQTEKHLAHSFFINYLALKYFSLLSRQIDLMSSLVIVTRDSDKRNDHSVGLKLTFP